jgi:nucleoid-associated protein YgaU
MSVVVWSERDDPRAGHRWKDCTYCTYLMALIFGGRTSFPKGIYTADEREAFESSDSRPDETGANLGNADEAAGRRYGPRFVLKAPTDELTIALTRVGTALVLQGDNGRLPAGDPWRRWDPHFDGDHALLGIPLGNGKVRILDPEAPWRFAGDVVPIEKVLNWAFQPASKYARVVHAGAFLPKTYTVRRGDSLSSIAAALHVPGGWRALYAVNRSKIGANPNLIRPGLVLRLPPGSHR